jgi:hypothetical protein
MNTPVLQFDKTGTGRCLHTEAIDLSTLGALEITRASTIEFDNQTQQWQLRSVEGILLFGDPSRQSCLDWEHQYFSQ